MEVTLQLVAYIMTRQTYYSFKHQSSYSHGSDHQRMSFKICPHRLMFCQNGQDMEVCHYVCNDDLLRSTSKIKNDVLDFSLMTSLSLLM